MNSFILGPNGTPTQDYILEGDWVLRFRHDKHESDGLGIAIYYQQQFSVNLDKYEDPKVVKVDIEALYTRQDGDFISGPFEIHSKRINLNVFVFVVFCASERVYMGFSGKGIAASAESIKEWCTEFISLRKEQKHQLSSILTSSIWEYIKEDNDNDDNDDENG